MGFRRLFLFVEGDDDERFFKSLLPFLGERYDHVDFASFRYFLRKHLGLDLK